MRSPLSIFPPRARRPVVVGVIAVLVLAFAGGWLRGRSLRFNPRYGIAVDTGHPVKDFTLTSHNGQPVSLSDFRGSVVLLYFGYTTCPDVCPTTLSVAHKAIELLGTRAANVNLLMVTVDPERDTPAVLAEYMSHFDRKFIGLRGDDDKVSAVATKFGVFYERKKADSALGYLVDHTATLMLIDAKGQLRLLFPYGITAEQLAADTALVLDQNGL